MSYECSPFCNYGHSSPDEYCGPYGELKSKAMKNNIPTNALRVRYCYGEHKGFYFVWPSGRKWQWSAAGSNGEEDTLGQAQEAARQWIISDRVKITNNKEIQ